MDIVKSLTSKIKGRKRHLLYLTLLSLPILAVYGTAFLTHPFNTAWGDSDFFFAMYEAMRVSILEYHQFPWWNPWIAGGIPLYADPQFGLVSLQTPLILLFGTPLGWKLALIAYLLVGFYGLRKLFKDCFNTPEITAVLLALIWAFSWLWATRSGGHYTFFVMAYLPWILLLYWRRKEIRYSWIWLGLLIALCINTAIHNMTIMIFLFFMIFVVVNAASTIRQKGLSAMQEQMIFLIKAGGLALILSLHKIYFTLRYASEFSKDPDAMPPEIFSGIATTFHALWGISPQFIPNPLPSGWGSTEAWVGLGFGTFLVLLFIGVAAVIRSKFRINSYVKSFSFNPFVLMALFFAFLLLSFGDFTTLAPYSFLRELPVFNQTRVSVRWLIFAGITALFIIAAFKQRDKLSRIIVNSLLLISVIQLITNIYSVLSNTYTYAPIKAEMTSQVPHQYKNWAAPRMTNEDKEDVSLYGGVVNNIDQVATNHTPYFDTTHNNTARCDEREPHCSYVLTHNARVVSWTPNQIVLERTAKGPITLNINPSNRWLINGTYTFGSHKSAETFVDFTITDPADKITLEYAPVGSRAWWSYKF